VGRITHVIKEIVMTKTTAATIDADIKELERRYRERPVEIAIGEISIPSDRIMLPLDHIGELAASMRTIGLLTPIILRKRSGGGFWLVTGRRRYEAAKRLGWASIPASVRELSPTEARRIEIDSNIYSRR
jgi:ParB/RepB/Spo0J family partition protein